MKNEIHPEYFNAEVSCVCGHKYNTGATQNEIKVEKEKREKKRER